MMSPDDYQTLIVSRNGTVATVTLNRPDSLNALNATLKAELEHCLFEQLLPDPDTAVVVLTGTGRSFSVGADVKERTGQQLSATEFHLVQAETERLFSRIANLPKPLIASVNGFAFGGGAEIALLCDLRIASEDATFALPETGLGMIPLGGGTQRLPRLVGVAHAKELIFTGRRIDSREALAIGLVNAIVPAAELSERVQQTAKSIADRAPLAVRYAKRAIDGGSELAVESGIEVELLCGVALYDTEDRREGMRAFVDKRPPKFAGR